MIRIQNLCVRQGTFALDDVSFEVPQGEYAVLMGKTGSGKTTVLESICGLRPIMSGKIILHGEDVTRLKPSRRGIGLVPQDGALFENMTVWEHLAFALVIRKWSQPKIEERVWELASMLSIEGLLARYPQGLSGGEKQRVSLGRALASHPSVLCLDEPLSALDDETREMTYELLKSVQQQTGVTALHITHSLAEAKVLADRFFKLESGSVRLVTENGQDTSRPGSNGTGHQPDSASPKKDPAWESP